MGWQKRQRNSKLKALLSILDPEGRPNRNALVEITKNIRLIELNIKSFGYDLALKLAQDLPVRSGTVSRPVGLWSKASTQADMECDWVAHWASELKTPVVFHRKLWELAYVLQAIYEHGHLIPGARGIGFACGREPVPSYLVSKGVGVTVTDLALEEAQEKGWVSSNQHSDGKETSFHPHIVDRDTFEGLADFQVADMNNIPTDLRDRDFCWSMCAMEHLGSIRQGLDFVENSLAVLRPGGLSVHTMEFNIEGEGPTIDNWMTVLFQRKHLEELAARLRSKGHWVADFDWNFGDKPMDKFIDIPPWLHDLPEEYLVRVGHPHHLKVGIDGFVSTCFGIIVKKAE